MKPDRKTYEINIAGLIRELPIVQVTDNMAIASFVLLGDSQLVLKAAAELLPRLPEVDYLITAEAKGIPLVQELSRLLKMDRYFVARKSIKPYMVHPFVTEVYSITTQKKQILCLDEVEAKLIAGKRVLIVDDVISTGESLKAMETLVKKAGGVVAGKAAILAEGDAAKRDDILFLRCSSSKAAKGAKNLELHSQKSDLSISRGCAGCPFGCLFGDPEGRGHGGRRPVWLRQDHAREHPVRRYPEAGK